ncbi:hypothetical protein HYX58_04500 [Candidatus Dependentiae bacterium]|nr:hypothetical protein [Candidatus Dependentiae bacterium]
MKYTSLRASCLITIGLITAPALCVATASADSVQAAPSQVNPVEKAVQILESYAQQQKSFREFVDELIKLIRENRETFKELITFPVPDKDEYIDDFIARLESVKTSKNPFLVQKTFNAYSWIVESFKKYIPSPDNIKKYIGVMVIRNK